MKHIKLLLLAILSIFLIPGKVLAANDPITLNAPKSASNDEEISVPIRLYSAVAIDNFKATFTYETTALELLNIENGSGWTAVSKFSQESPLFLEFTNENGITGDTVVATLKFKVKKDAAKKNTTLSVEGTTTTKADQTTNVLQKVTSTIEIRSTDNSLKDLKFNGNTLDYFSPNIYSYELQVAANVTTADFEATPNDKTATFKAKYEPKKGASLDYGENIFEIIVVSASNEEKKYTVKVIRQDNRGENNNLNSLSIVSDKTIYSYDKTELSKNLTINLTTHKLEKIEINAEPQDPKATIDGAKEYELKIGINEIKITVTSEKKDQKVYTLIINNLDREIDTSLSDITLFYDGDELDIGFEKDKYDYEVTYNSRFNDNLVIKPIVNNEEEAEVVFDDDLSKLSAGSKITIRVVAKNGAKDVETTYSITFLKDNRINFFLVLGIIIFVVLLIIFIKLFINYKKEKKKVIETEKDLEKTKRLEKINLE